MGGIKHAESVGAKELARRHNRVQHQGVYGLYIAHSDGQKVRTTTQYQRR